MSTDFEIINLFIENIREELRSRIKCKFTIYNEENTLWINIYHDEFQIHWVEDYVLEKLHMGKLSAKSIVDGIENKMKKDILAKYFYQKVKV